MVRLLSPQSIQHHTSVWQGRMLWAAMRIEGPPRIMPWTRRHGWTCVLSFSLDFIGNLSILEMIQIWENGAAPQESHQNTPFFFWCIPKVHIGRVGGGQIFLPAVLQTLHHLVGHQLIQHGVQLSGPLIPHNGMGVRNTPGKKHETTIFFGSTFHHILPCVSSHSIHSHFL